MGSINSFSRERHNGVDAHDEFVSKVNTIEVIGGGLVRVTFLVNHNDGNGMVAVPAKFAIVIPLTEMPDGIGKAMLAIGRKVIAGDGGIKLAH